MIGSIEVVNPYAYWNDIDPAELSTPAVANWFNLEQTENVKGRDLGWLLAQGWVVDGNPTADPEEPGNLVYDLKRNELQSETILNTLISEYVTAYNDGRQANDQRYDDLVVMYNDTLLKTQSHLNRAATANNSYEVLYINNLDSIRSQVDFLLNTTRSDASSTFDEAATALNAFSSKLTELGTGYDEYVGELETILTNQQADLAAFEGNTTTLLTNLTSDFTTHQAAIDALESTEDSQATTHIAAYEAELDELEAAVTTAETALLALVTEAEGVFTNYETAAEAIITAIATEYTALDSTITGLMTSLDTAVGTHQVTHDGLVDLFLSDYTTHAATSRALLVDLGSTELARINEAFDNQLADALQKLTDRGFYSSAQVTDVTARNTREKNEAIAELNDKLAREKNTNEHKLFDEQSAVRQRQVAGEEYQFQMTKLANDFRAQWAEQLYKHAAAAQQIYQGIRAALQQAENQVITQETAIRERLTAWKLDAKKAVADGKDRIYQVRNAITRWKTDSEFKQADALRAIRSARLDVFSKTLAASLDVEKTAAVARESIVNKLNAYIAEHASGVARYADMTVRNGQFLAGVRDRATAQAIETRFRYATGLDHANAAQQRLLAYQLDTRNGLAVGMFGMMERREDSYPDISAMGQVASALGDAGATSWVQP